jgi:predicted ATPase
VGAGTLIGRDGECARLADLVRGITRGHGATTVFIEGEAGIGKTRLLGGAIQFRAVEELIDRIERLTDSGPVLLGLDDLHWADSSTLLAVRWITRRLTQVPLLLVATLRPSPHAAELSQLFDDVARAGVETIQLPTLSSLTWRHSSSLSSGSRRVRP